MFVWGCFFERIILYQLCFIHLFLSCLSTFVSSYYSINIFYIISESADEHFKAVKESATASEIFLQEIFEERDTYDEVLSCPEIRQVEELPSEQVLGRDHEKTTLFAKLFQPDKAETQLAVIPITGPGGVGKTALARLVYEADAVKSHFEVRAWLKLEGQELRLRYAAEEILKSATGVSFSMDDLDGLDEMVRDTLHSQRCLIVFDGIEYLSKDLWLHMCKKWFDFLDLGSKLVITTTSKDVVKLVAEEAIVLTQSSLEHNKCVCSYLAFSASENAQNMSIIMAKNLSALCKGIPLSLKLVGSFIRYNDKLRNLLSSVDFSDSISLSPSDASVAVLLCMWGLPPHLRKCLAYCIVFPRGIALNKEKIIDMWIARGLVKPSPCGNSLGDIGNSYFHQLKSMSFFTDITRDQYDNIIEFRIPGLIHKMAEDVSRTAYKEKLGFIASISEDGRHLSLSPAFSGEYKSQDLRTLVLSPEMHSSGCPCSSFLEFTALQSLDLSCSGIKNLSHDISGLKELRYLNLSFTLVERLPDSITNLSQLRTLDLSWSYRLKVLPEGMRHLTDMNRLDLYQCESLSYLPSGIGFLTSLTSMPLFVLGEDSDCARLGELGLLNELRGRLEIRNLENVRETTEARNAKLDQKHLQHLALAWSQNSGDQFKVLEALKPNPNLKVLDLTGYMGSEFPSWISSTISLIKISISDCGCKELPSLGRLPFLKALQLKGMANLDCIGPEFHGNSDVSFPSLEQLGLYDLPRLSEFSGEAVPGFRFLKTLTIEGCPRLTSLPSLPTLSELIVCRSNNSILSSLSSFTSLSSLLINDMELGVSNFQDLTWLDSLKKLILCNIKDKLIVNISRVETTFASLEHLTILHCHHLTDLCLFYFSSLKKLQVVDCPNLFRILVRDEEDTPLVELVVEDCPEVFSEICFYKLKFLRKLILRNCGGHFTTSYAGEYKKLEKLEYLYVNRCPKMQHDMQTFPSLISHVPCIIVGDRKANYYRDMPDLAELPRQALSQSEEQDLKNQRPDIEAGFERLSRCFAGLCRERRDSRFLRAMRRTSCFDNHAMAAM